MNKYYSVEVFDAKLQRWKPVSQIEHKTYAQAENVVFSEKLKNTEKTYRIVSNVVESQEIRKY